MTTSPASSRPLLSLRDLDEPVMVGLGALLDEEDSEAYVRLLVAPRTVRLLPPQARPVLDFLSVPRRHCDVLAGITAWDGEPGDLDVLAQEQLVATIEPGDDHSLAEQLGPFRLVAMFIGARASASGSSILIDLDSDHTVRVAPLTAAVLDNDPETTLEERVCAVGRTVSQPADVVWAELLSDLLPLLATGAVHLSAGVPEENVPTASAHLKGPS